MIGTLLFLALFDGACCRPVSFDYGNVGLPDWTWCLDALSGPVEPYPMKVENYEMCDIDYDCDVDLRDFAEQIERTGNERMEE